MYGLCLPFEDDSTDAPLSDFPKYSWYLMELGSNFTPLILESVLWPQWAACAPGSELCYCCHIAVNRELATVSESEEEAESSTLGILQPLPRVSWCPSWIWWLFLEIIVRILVSSPSNSFHIWGQVSQRPGGENWTRKEASLSPGLSCHRRSQVLISLHGSQTVFPYLLGETLAQRAPFWGHQIRLSFCLVSLLIQWLSPMTYSTWPLVS